MGVMATEKAVKKAEEEGLDLVQITAKAEPPVCKIRDYGKYVYELKKKKKKAKKTNKAGELKEVQLTFNISDHDLETRKKRVLKFLKANKKIRLRMRLRGREHALKDYARKKIKNFMKEVGEEVPIKVERRLKKERGGLAAIIRRA